MSPALIDLLDILDLETLEVNLFRGRNSKNDRWRVFGGQVVAQALVAACRTVEDVATRPPHSLHAYFLLGGDPKVPIVYDVERIRDGKSFTTRRVVAIQSGRPIFSMSVSFHGAEEGFSHQAKIPDVPPPEALVGDRNVTPEMLAAMPDVIRRYFERERAIEVRPVEIDRYLGRKGREPRFHMWFRTVDALPDDPIVHRAVLAYVSDMTLLDATLIPHGRSVLDGTIMPASLDHALWLHRPFRVDDWLLYAQDSPTAEGGRGFARGAIFSRDGTLVASTAQEGIIRPKRG